MSPWATIVVTVVALALPLSGFVDALAVAGDPPGIARPQSHQVVAAEVEADIVDDIDEHPHDRGWQAGGATLTADVESTRCGFLHVPPGSDVRGGRPDAATIRGPPAIG